MIRFLAASFVAALMAYCAPAYAACTGSGACVLSDNGTVQSPYSITRVLSPLDYGAKCDATTVNSASVTISSGAAALTVTGASFALADVGKTISVYGAGAAGANLVTTISAYTSATQVTLAANASTSLAGVGGVVSYGTDDSTAITNWAAAIVSGSDAVLPNSACLFNSAVAFPNVNYWTIRGTGEQSQLLYSGATTTGNILTFGDMTNGASCSSKGMQIKNFRAMSNTTMTSGSGVAFGHLCETEIQNFRAGADLDGANSNWFNAVQFYGGNTIHMRGYSFRGSNIAEIISGDGSNQFTDMYQTQGKISHSTVGLNIAGRVGGFTIDQTDILLSVTNVLIDQSQQATANNQIFFGSGVAVDATSAAGVGFRISDAGGANSFLNLAGTWLASAVAGSGSQGVCLLIDSGSAFTIQASDLIVTNCHNDGIQNNSTSSIINISSGYFYLNTGYGINNTVANTNISVSGRFRSNTAGDTNGVKSVLAFDNGLNAIFSTVTGSVKLGASGSCGIWLGTAQMQPGDPAAGSAGCTYNAGSTTAPFQIVNAVQFQANGTTPTNTGTCAITTQSGGSTAGRFVANGACAGGTLIFSMPTAAHGWVCDTHDLTTPADAMNQTATTTTSVTFTGSMANSDVMVFHCLGY